jgi:DNA polymerase-3 subunit delta'
MLPILITGQTDQDRLQKATAISANLLNTPSDKLVNHPDFLRLIPNPSITIEMVREIIKALSRKPYQSDVVVVLIEQAHLATIEAQNSLLKVLEEPPDYVQLILTAPNIDSLLATVASRCKEIVLSSKVAARNTTNDKNMDDLFRCISEGNIQDLIGKFPIDRQELLSTFDQLIVIAEHELVMAKLPKQIRLANIIRSASKTRTHIENNANIRLAVANFLLSRKL